LRFLGRFLCRRDFLFGVAHFFGGIFRGFLGGVGGLLGGFQFVSRRLHVLRGLCRRRLGGFEFLIIFLLEFRDAFLFFLGLGDRILIPFVCKFGSALEIERVAAKRNVSRPQVEFRLARVFDVDIAAVDVAG